MSTATGPALCTITGQVFNPDGSPLVNGTVQFDSVIVQIVGGFPINPTFISTTTDANGNLVAIALPMGLVVQVTICPPVNKGGNASAPFQVIIPFTTTANLGEMSLGMKLAAGNPGVTDGSDAAAGQIGEFITANGSGAIPATAPGSAYTVAETLTLNPGDWDVYANFYTLISASGGTVVGGTAWWGVLCPSSLPLGSTDGTPPSASVAWIGGADTAIPLSDGGTIGPVRLSSATAAGMDIRLIVSGTSGTAQISWAISARRMR